MKATHMMWALQTQHNYLVKPLVSTGMPYLTFSTKKEALEHIIKWNMNQTKVVKIKVVVCTTGT